MADKVRRLGYLADIFSKLNQVSLHHKTHGQYLLLRINSGSQVKIEFWKTCVYHFELDSFSILDFFGGIRSVVLLMKAIFWFPIRKCSALEDLYKPVFKCPAHDGIKFCISKRSTGRVGEVNRFS